MEDTPLTKVDLNLLVVLDILLREKSVGRTAERLNLTSPAVSHALKRLRELFDNELLVRQGRGMVPTMRARMLAEALPGLLDHIQRTLAEPQPFDPATSTRTFRIVAPDFVMPLVMNLLEVIGRKAPGIRVDLIPFSTSTISEVKQGLHDALISPSGGRQDDLRGQSIGQSSWVVYGRRGHPAFADWSLDAWGSHPHLQVRASGSDGRSPVDLAIAKLGLSRRIGAVVPHFSVAAPALVRTDMLLTVPKVTMGDTPKVYDLEQRPVPFELRPLELSLFRNATSGDEPDVRWFLERVETACESLHIDG